MLKLLSQQINEWLRLSEPQKALDTFQIALSGLFQIRQNHTQLSAVNAAELYGLLLLIEVLKPFIPNSYRLFVFYDNALCITEQYNRALKEQNLNTLLTQLESMLYAEREWFRKNMPVKKNPISVDNFVSDECYQDMLTAVRVINFRQ